MSIKQSASKGCAGLATVSILYWEGASKQVQQADLDGAVVGTILTDTSSRHARASAYLRLSKMIGVGLVGEQATPVESPRRDLLHPPIELFLRASSSIRFTSRRKFN